MESVCIWEIIATEKVTALSSATIRRGLGTYAFEGSY